MLDENQLATPQADKQADDGGKSEIPPGSTSSTDTFLAAQTASSLKQRLAEQIGEDQATLKVIGDAAAVLARMQEGVIIDLHIGGTRRFWKQLELQDLGLEGQDAPEPVLGEQAKAVLTDYFQLGKLSLLPKNKQLAHLGKAERAKFVSFEDFENFDRSARNVLYRHSFKSHWGHFVPVTSYKAWQAENEEWKQKFLVLKERLLDNYDTIIDFVVEAYRPLAFQAWKMVSIHTRLRDAESVSETIVREVVSLLVKGKNREAFVENYLAYIRKAFKSRDSVASSFRYETEISIIPLPSLVAADMQHADRLYQERALKDAQVAAELERIEQERRVQRAASYTLEQEALEKRQLTLQAERDRLAAQRQMEQEVLSSAREQKERLVAQFYRGVVGQINDQLQSICTSVLENIDHHEGQLRGPVSKQLRDLVQRLETMNFMNDEKITAMLANIQDALPSKEESERAAKGLANAKIQTDRLQTTLRQVASSAQAVVIDLGMIPTVRKVRREEVLADESLLETDTRKKKPDTLFVDGQKKKPRSRVTRDNPLA